MHVKCITIRTTATFKKHIHFRGEKNYYYNYYGQQTSICMLGSGY